MAFFVLLRMYHFLKLSVILLSSKIFMLLCKVWHFWVECHYAVFYYFPSYAECIILSVILSVIMLCSGIFVVMQRVSFFSVRLIVIILCSAPFWFVAS